MDMHTEHNNKRRLPRHVDGRIKIGYMPLKNFLFFLPIGIIIIIFTILLISTYHSPFFLFLGALLIGLGIAIFSEINNKETGLDIFKDMLRYKKEGDRYYERSCVNVRVSKRCIRNKIK